MRYTNASVRSSATGRANGIFRLAGSFGIVLAIVAPLAGCSSSDAPKPEPLPDIIYQSDSSLLTVNAQSALGLATGADEAAARIYPGPFISGADHQTIPNRDLATVVAHPENDTVTYSINPEAVFSDGEPITCDDFFLSWTASEYRQLFHTAPSVMNAITGIECQPGSKDFVVTVEKGATGRFWQFFIAGTVMPSHIVAKQAEIPDMHALLVQAQQFRQNTATDVNELDRATIEATLPELSSVATSWEKSFTLIPENLPNLVTSGPYEISDITMGKTPDTVEKIEVKTNKNWWGDKPETSPIQLYSATSSLADQAARDTLFVASTKSGKAEADSSSYAPIPTSPSPSKSQQPGKASTPNPTSADTPTDKAPSKPEDSGNAPAAGDSRPSQTAAITGIPPVPEEKMIYIGGKEFRYAHLSGGKITSLVPANTGVVADPEARRALNGCIDRGAVAHIVSESSGQTVTGTALHMTPPTDPMFRSLQDINDANNRMDLEATKKLLGGKTIRLGFNDVVPMHEKIAQEIATSCKKADVDVIVSHSRTQSQADLGSELDLFITDVDPAIAYPSIPDGEEGLPERRQAENQLWNGIPTIPLVPVAKNVLWSPFLTNVVPSSSWGGVGWNLDRWIKETDG